MNSVTQYLDQLRQGDEEAAQVIFERFQASLVRLAQRKLQSSSLKHADGEDVVQVVLEQFFRQVQDQQRFGKLHDRNDLWQILAMLVDRKATDEIRRANTKIRGGGAVNTESVFFQQGVASERKGIDALADQRPTELLASNFLNVLSEELKGLTATQQNAVLLKMQGHTETEIASLMNSSKRSVQRMFHDIRKNWRSEDPE